MIVGRELAGNQDCAHGLDRLIAMPRLFQIGRQRPQVVGRKRTPTSGDVTSRYAARGNRIWQPATLSPAPPAAGDSASSKSISNCPLGSAIPSSRRTRRHRPSTTTAGSASGRDSSGKQSRKLVKLAIDRPTASSRPPASCASFRATPTSSKSKYASRRTSRFATSAPRRVPMANRGDRHADQLGQHRRRVQPLDRPAPHRPSPSRAQNSDSRTSSASPRRGLNAWRSSNTSGSAATLLRSPSRRRRRPNRPARRRRSTTLPAALADQLLDVTPRHAGELADDSTRLPIDRLFRMCGRGAHGRSPVQAQLRTEEARKK